MKQCPGCHKRYDDGWGICLQCSVKLEVMETAQDSEKIKQLKAEVEDIKGDLLKLQQRINWVECELSSANTPGISHGSTGPIKENQKSSSYDETEQKVQAAIREMKKSLAQSKDRVKARHELSPAAASSEAVPTQAAFPAQIAEVKIAEAKPRKGFEETLGGQWFNKLGILAVVVGVTLLIGYSYRYMGAATRIGIGFLFGFGLLGAGIFLEKKKGFEVYAKTLIAGGWAITYFTTYAMHHVPVVRLVQNPILGTLLLLGVSCASVWHIQRYKSQVASALTYLLVFVTLIITPVSLYTITASLCVAGSLIYFMHKMKWNEFAIYGIIMSYFTQMVSGGKPLNAQGFWIVTGLITLYWFVYAAAACLMDPKNDKIKLTGTFGTRDLSFAINSLFAAGIGELLLKSGYSQFTDALLVLGCALHLAVSCLTYTPAKRNLSHISSLYALGFAGIYLARHFSGYSLTIAGLILANLLMFAGIVLKDRFWRLLANGVFAALLLKLLAIDVTHENAKILSSHVTDRALCFVAAFAMFLINHVLQRRSEKRLEPAHEEKRINALMSYAFPLIYMVGTWLDLPKILTAPAWVVFGVILFERGVKTKDMHARLQGLMLTTGAFTRLMLSNMTVEGTLVVLSYRVWTVVPTLFVLQYCYLRFIELWKADVLTVNETLWSKAYVYFVFIGIYFLIRQELPAVWVAPAWTLLAVGYAGVGRGRPMSAYGMISCFGAISAVVRVMFVNIAQPHYLAGSPTALAPVILTIAGLYLGNCYYVRRMEPLGTGEKSSSNLIRRFFSYADWQFSLAATAAVTVFMLYQFKGAAATIGLGVEGLILLAAGLLLKNRSWRISGLLVILVAFIKAFVIDLRHLETIFYILAVICLGLILLAVSYIYTRHKERIKKLL
jgi:hypothetical protein